MRMYPVALSVVRRAAQTFEFEGYRVEAGETIIVATSVCHFLTEFYPIPGCSTRRAAWRRATSTGARALSSRSG